MLIYIPRNAERILEIGCGIGNFGSAIKNRQVAEVWGIERNENLFKHFLEIYFGYVSH